MEFSAAVLTAVNQPLSIERVTLTGLAPRDVLIRNAASGLCHTDLEIMCGSLAYPVPVVLGHEGAGVVEAVGEEVVSLKPGDHVIASWNPHCGHCFYCERDQPILCEPLTRYQPAGLLPDGRSRLRLNGEMLHHFSVVSSHAQFSVVTESGAIKIPQDMPLDRACLIGCGVMTGVGAVSRLAQVQAGTNVLIIGCGAVGLNAIQAAAFEQADRVIAVDRDDSKLALASRFGATHVMHADDSTLEMIKAATAGRGADYVFEAAGSEAALQLAMEATRPGGQLVILGKTEVNRKVGFRFGSMMGEKRIIRSSYGGARPLRDFPWLAQRYLDGKLNLDDLISTRLPLDRINEGFDAMRNGQGIRHVVTFD
jgi:S-(hydroxymethyl)glutathione dehydrogenase/alcohol dehydrogenase